MVWFWKKVGHQCVCLLCSFPSHSSRLFFWKLTCSPFSWTLTLNSHTELWVVIFTMWPCVLVVAFITRGMVSDVRILELGVGGREQPSCFPLKFQSSGQSDSSIRIVKAKNDAVGVAAITNMCWVPTTGQAWLGVLAMCHTLTSHVHFTDEGPEAERFWNLTKLKQKLVDRGLSAQIFWL